MAMLASGMSMLNRLLGAAGAVAGVFTWPDAVTTTITTAENVVPGASAQSTLPGAGDATTRVTITERVLLLPAASLTKNGTATLPVTGLRWTETINGESCKFEVMPAAGETAWDYSDPSGRTRLRLRMKRVKV